MPKFVNLVALFLGAAVALQVFGEDWPASATVGVADLLLGAKLEVDAIAVVAAAS